MDPVLAEKIRNEGARTVPPREHGGNCDIKNLSKGSVIYFPVYVPVCTTKQTSVILSFLLPYLTPNLPVLVPLLLFSFFINLYNREENYPWGTFISLKEMERLVFVGQLKWLECLRSKPGQTST